MTYNTDTPVQQSAGCSVRFVKLPVEVLARTDLTAADKLIFAALADRVGSNDDCWPGQRCLARDCGLSPGAIPKCVERLHKAGLIEVEHVGSNSLGKSNRYRLQSERPRSERPQNEHERSQSKRGRLRSSAEPDQGNQTKRTRPNKRGHKGDDPWELARAAMTNTVLDTDQFQRAWSDWVTHRREKRAAVTPLAIQRQIRRLEKIGHDRAIAAVEHSIEQGYTGIYEGNTSRQRKADPRRRHPAENVGEARIL